MLLLTYFKRKNTLLHTKGKEYYEEVSKLRKKGKISKVKFISPVFKTNKNYTMTTTFVVMLPLKNYTDKLVLNLNDCLFWCVCLLACFYSTT